MKLTVNGESCDLPAGATVRTLVATLGLDQRKLAVERNREIVPKSLYDSAALADGDVVEIVHFVGGG